jgi:hypothetical protein
MDGKQLDTRFERTTWNRLTGASRRRGDPTEATLASDRAGVQPVVLEEGADAQRRAGPGATVAPWEDGLHETPLPGSAAATSRSMKPAASVSGGTCMRKLMRISSLRLQG